MRKRILLVEDREIVRTGMENMINRKSKNKITIDAAKSFYDALEHMSKNNYDVIILDLNMAGIKGDTCFDEFSGTTLNGWLFLKEYIFKEGAKYKDKCAKTKIIIYSGFAKELREMIKQLPQGDKQKRWFSNTELVGKVTGEYKGITQIVLDYLDVK